MTPRLAVVGCGAVLEHLHKPALDRLRRDESVQVAAIVDPVASMRNRAAKWFEPALACATFEEALATGVDCVLILSPPASHVNMILEAVNCGLTVLCEKPLAERADSAERLLAEGNHHLASVAMVRRQFDTVRFLRRNLESLVDTSDFEIRYYEGGPYSWPIVSGASFDRSTGGVGVILDTGIHILDLLCWTFGSAQISRVTTDETTELVARNANIKLQFGGGLASLTLSWTDPLPAGLTIESRLGTVWLPTGPESVIFQRRTGDGRWKRLDASPTKSSRGINSSQGRCSSLEMAALLQLAEFLGPNRDHLATVDEALSLLKMLDQGQK